MVRKSLTDNKMGSLYFDYVSIKNLVGYIILGAGVEKKEKRKTSEGKKFVLERSEYRFATILLLIVC